MTTVYHNNPHTAASQSVINTTTNINSLAGHKRSFNVDTAPFPHTDSAVEFTASKRTNSYSNNTFWTADIVTAGVASPKTPESGIDMNIELGCSPPCYSVTRTPELATTTTAMNCDPQILNSQTATSQSKDGFMLYIADEPEENYRARYDSEGCRGPMKGRQGGCPTVELISSASRYWLNADVKVELVAADRSPLNSCKLDSTEEGTNLYKKLPPGENRVSFENLRIRRLKKGDTTAKGTAAGNLKQQQQPSKQQPTGLKGARTKQDEKVAYLLFTAHVQAESREIIELKVLSQAIHLNASHDPPEIHCIVPPYASEGDSVAIIGTRMHSPRVSFLYSIDGKDHEVMADINKEFSHQNALVIKVPGINASAFSSNIAAIRICVTAGKGDRTGKEPLKSGLMPFYCVYNGVCKECVMTTTRQQFSYNPPSSVIASTTSTRPPSTRMDSSKPILNPPRHISKSVSPRPSIVARSTPGYISPPPRTPLPSTSTYTAVCTPPGPPVVSSLPPPTPVPTTQHHMITSKAHDEVDDLLRYCQSSAGPLECPITSPQLSPHYSVIHSTADQIMGFAGDSHSGPVSPDELNLYLPNNNQSAGVVGATFVPSTSSCVHISQDFTGTVFSDASVIVRPSLGHFSQTS